MTEYISTRGGAPALSFRDSALAGLAPDGGLYVPAAWPALSASALASLRSASYVGAAHLILSKFAPEWPSADLQADLERAYASFSTPDIVRLRHIEGDDWLLELFHGPSLAFKDIAMQTLARFFLRALTETRSRALILCATSGDTGGAAAAAFANAPDLPVVILFPDGRISEVQRRFITATGAENIHAVAVDGDFDACQAIVKALFARNERYAGRRLAGVNSINWARIAIQCVYYFVATAALRQAGETRPPRFSVPTGNFGDVFSGFAARTIGLKTEPFIAGVNENDVLARALQSGLYALESVKATIAPAMDIQTASNFERLIFEASGRNLDETTKSMSSLARERRFTLSPATLAAMRAVLSAIRVDQSSIHDTIADLASRRGLTIDPHTAVGVAAMRRARAQENHLGPMIGLATAHPAKFPETVSAATGAPAPEPPVIADLLSRRERYVRAPAAIDAMRDIVNVVAAR